MYKYNDYRGLCHPKCKYLQQMCSDVDEEKIRLLLKTAKSAYIQLYIVQIHLIFLFNN